MMLRAHALAGDWRIDSSKRVQGPVLAGSLRVSLSSSCSSSPKTGGQGVDSEHEDGAGGYRFALSTLHVDSRFRGNDKTSAANSHCPRGRQRC